MSEVDVDAMLGSTQARVGVIMGSQSDWETMREACNILDQFGVPYEARVVSAHRTPKWMVQYAEKAAGRGLQILIAGAGELLTYLVWSLRVRRYLSLEYLFRAKPYQGLILS